MDTSNQLFCIPGFLTVVLSAQVAFFCVPAIAGTQVHEAGPATFNSNLPCGSLSGQLCGYVPPTNPGNPPSDASGTR